MEWKEEGKGGGEMCPEAYRNGFEQCHWSVLRQAEGRMGLMVSDVGTVEEGEDVGATSCHGPTSPGGAHRRGRFLDETNLLADTGESLCTGNIILPHDMPLTLPRINKRQAGSSRESSGEYLPPG